MVRGHSASARGLGKITVKTTRHPWDESQKCHGEMWEESEWTLHQVIKYIIVQHPRATLTEIIKVFQSSTKKISPTPNPTPNPSPTHPPWFPIIFPNPLRPRSFASPDAVTYAAAVACAMAWPRALQLLSEAQRRPRGSGEAMT